MRYTIKSNQNEDFLLDTLQDAYLLLQIVYAFLSEKAKT